MVKKKKKNSVNAGDTGLGLIPGPGRSHILYRLTTEPVPQGGGTATPEDCSSWSPSPTTREATPVRSPRTATRNSRRARTATKTQHSQKQVIKKKKKQLVTLKGYSPEKIYTGGKLAYEKTLQV